MKDQPKSFLIGELLQLDLALPCVRHTPPQGQELHQKYTLNRNRYLESLDFHVQTSLTRACTLLQAPDFPAKPQ